MSYKLNKTDGTLLTDLIDGVLDTDTTDLALVGRNYTGFGEFLNENFIKLLENFANPNEPINPLRGQIWYDTSENKLKIFDGDEFQSAAGSFIGNLILPFPLLITLLISAVKSVEISLSSKDKICVKTKTLA